MRKNSKWFILVVAFLIGAIIFVGCKPVRQQGEHQHNLSFVAEISATENENGVKAHYVCSGCNGLFLDEEGSQCVTADDLVLDKLPHVHVLSFVSAVPATEDKTGVKAHYVCSGCDELFLDEAGRQKVTAEELILRFLKNDESLSINYVFSGNEADVKGYAEGVVVLNSTTGFQKDDVLDFCWGNGKEILRGYYPIFTKKITSSGADSVTFDMEENIYIPQQATQIVVLKNNEYACCFDITADKLYATRELISKYAVVSDVHLNYSQSNNHLLNALNEFEDLGVEYIIMSGDIGKEPANYTRYATVCKQSRFTGLIFSSTGNHDQEMAENKIKFKECAVYDGAKKAFVNLNDVVEYFGENGGYSGSLDVTAHYQNLEGDKDTLYYYVEIGNNLYFFMDQMLDIGSSTPRQDNFSIDQLNLLESVLYQNSNKGKNLFIVEHAPIEQYKVGDKFTPGYGAQLKISAAYVNNVRFANILKEYTEVIMLTGHTHVRFDTAMNYIDKAYNEKEVLTDTPLARTFHVSSLSEPRWYQGDKIKMDHKNTQDAASECYLVFEYSQDIVFEGNSLKEGGDHPYERNVFSKYSYVIPTINNSHNEPIAVGENDTLRGEIFYNDLSLDIGTAFSRGLSFEYKITTSDTLKAKFYGANADGSMNWDKYYGDFELTNDGGVYDGLTFTSLPDGYVRVEMDFSKIKKLPHGAPKNVRYIYFEQIRQDGIKTVYDGYIDNLKAFAPIVSEDEDELRGEFFSNGSSRDLGAVFTKGLSFEYKITTGNAIKAKFYAANPDGTMNWDKYYGDFELTNDGGDYDGLTVTLLPDGYVRVEMDFSKIMKLPHGVPANVGYIYLEQIKKNDVNTVYECYIDNVIEFTPVVSEDDVVTRGVPFAAGSNTSYRGFTANSKLTFDYKIQSGSRICVALMDDWGTVGGYFGYYYFDNDGVVGDIAGITTVKLDDGYIRVTAIFSQITKTDSSNGMPSNVDHLYVRDWTDASGYIDNIVCE